MIANILKQIRESRHLTQQDVANGINVNSSTYKNYEYGRREPDLKTVSKLADFYGVTTDYLLGREPLQYSIEEQELIKKYQKLDNLGKQSVNNIIKSEIDRQNAVAIFREYINNREKYGTEKAAEMLNDKITKNSTIDKFIDL